MVVAARHARRTGSHREKSMNVSATVKSIHRFAVLRYHRGGDGHVQIVIQPDDAMKQATPSDAPPAGESADRATTWLASTRQGGGDWGNVAGEGGTPEEALGRLLSGLLDAHRAVDERRAKALEKVADAT
jgi:hypothetical protein